MPHASYAPSSTGITAAGWWVGGGLALATGCLAGWLNLVVQLVIGGISPLDIIPLFLTPVAFGGAVLAGYGSYRLRAELRMQALAAANPNAFLLHLVLPPRISSLWKSAALAMQAPVGRFPTFSGYGVLVADTESLRVYTGGSRPQLSVSLPTASLTGARVDSAVFGLRRLSYIFIEVTDPSGRPWPIELLPVAWPGVIPKAIPDAAFPAELGAMRSATHPGV